MIQALLSRGADPNKQDNEEIGFNTPIHKAVEKNMLDVVELFLEHGADPTIQNKNGFTTLHIAAKEGLLDMCKLLMARGKFQIL